MISPQYKSFPNYLPVSEKNQIRNSSQFSEAEGAMAYLSLLLLIVNLELLSNSRRGSRLGTGSGFMTRI